MSGLSIRTRAGVFRAELDGSDISNAIWLSLPLELYTNMLGGMAYCECPLKAILPKEGRTTELDTGDIAYWPGPGALCFFFGSTPLSGEDGRPVAPYPVIRIGRILGDCSAMENMGDRQRIVLESDFRRKKPAALETAIVYIIDQSISDRMRQIDTGGLSFAEIRDSDKCYVDKSMLIADILSKNDRGIYLFTRPRRFGKTTNLTMLDAFFDLRYRGNTWFDGLEICDHHEFDGYRNAFPVIFVNLKDTKASNREAFVNRMRAALYNAFSDHRYLLDSDLVHPDEKTRFQDVLDRRTDEAFIRDCVPLLCKLLERYHGRKTVLLIDEYDRAVSDAFGRESHRPDMDFLGEFLNAALKSNDSLQMAYVTGVMRIATESMSSDPNNISVNNIFSKDSDERFGFTESEVKDLLSEYGHPEKFGEAKQWYDGYRFGDAVVYNPYSVMCYISSGFVPGGYWARSGGDIVLRWLLERINDDNFSRILELLEGESIVTGLKSALTFSRPNTSDVDLYSLMAMSGYLKAVPAGDSLFDISFPSMEVKGMADELMDDVSPIDDGYHAEFMGAVLDRDAERMASLLGIILHDGSYLDLSIENAYGIVLMMILHSLHKRYEIKTKYDAGNGRTDIVLKPRREGDVPMIFELKRVHSEKDLDKGLDETIGQIHDRRYYDGMPGKVVLIGMSFFVKTPKTRVEVIDNGPDGFGYSRTHPAVRSGCPARGSDLSDILSDAFSALYRFTKSPVSRERSIAGSGARRSAKQQTNNG